MAESKSRLVNTHFWDDKVRAQAILKEIADLKEEQAGKGKFDKGDAILSIISGAGGISYNSLMYSIKPSIGIYESKRSL